MTPAEEFVAFWAVYPKHVARFAAEKAFATARKRASFQQIIDGVQRYIQHKPSYADWCHAATWLRAGRWLDEYDVPVASSRQYWADECAELHGGTCPKQWEHEMRKRA